MDMKLELVPIPVTDVDRAKAFYTDQLGFVADVDVQPAPGIRVVQLTPPGSACSIGLGTGLAAYEAEPGTVRALHLVVDDIEKARAELVGRGVEMGEIQDVGGGVRTPASATPTATPGRCRRWPGGPGDALLVRPAARSCRRGRRCAARPGSCRRPTSARKSPERAT